MLAGENLRKSTSSPMCARTVTVNIKSRVVSVTGPRGTLKRSFKHQSFDMFVKDKRVYVEVYFGDRETRSVVRTIVSHIRNMMTGVTKVRKFSFLLLFAFASQ
jgi:large subunit ribosomal protein L9e